MNDTIEISAEDYTSMQNELERLRKTTQNQEKVNKTLKDKIETITEYLIVLNDISFYERIFEWKSIRKLIKKYLSILS